MYTRVHTTGKSVIDYVLVPLRLRKYGLISYFAVGESMPESDHRPLHYTVSVPYAQNMSMQRKTQCSMVERSYFKWKEGNKDTL